MARRVSSPVFVGRAAERASLAEALGRAAAGQPGIVLITGEAGVGKSRLLTEVIELATADRRTVVRGACLDVAAGTLPFEPFVDIVRGLHAAGLVRSLAPSARAELSRLVPELDQGRRAEHAPELGGQGRLFAAVRDLVSVASATSPIFVSIEDLHWADASTLDLFTYLARSLQTEACLMVVTTRLESLPRRHPMHAIVGGLARLPTFERIDLTGFDEPEMIEQLTGILGGPPEIDLVHEIFRRSDGNAFFAEELVAAGATPGGLLPASLREVLAARLETLDEATQGIVRIAAVAGRLVSHELLARVADVPSGALLTALRDAVDLGVLLHVADPRPGYTFRHALVREAAYDELLPAERIEIHRAIADALERDETLSPAGELARTGEIAFHAFAAQDFPRALTASVAAAAVAERASAHAEAEVQLDRILAIWPQVPNAESMVGMDHPAFLARTARAAAAAGHRARAVDLARGAIAGYATADTGSRITTLLDLFDYAWEAADMESAEHAVEQVMPMVQEERSAQSARAYIEASVFDWHHGRNASARTTALTAIEIARECSARPELALALSALGQAYTHMGETHNAEAAFAEAAVILEGSGDPVVRARSTWWRSWARFMGGSFEESLAMIRAGLGTARRDGSDGRYEVQMMEQELECLIELGRWTEADELGEQMLPRLSASFNAVYTHGSLARLATLRGRIDDAEALLARATDVDAPGPIRVWQLEDPIFLMFASRRFADGRRGMESAIAAVPEPDRDATLWWSLLKAVAGAADHADGARRRRRTAEVEDAVAAGHRFADLLRRSASAARESDGSSPLIGALLSSSAAESARLDGRPDAEAWAAAVTARSALAQPWELAYARYRYAEAILASRGTGADAAEPLRAAHATASELGAAPLQASIEALAARGRISLERRSESVGLDESATIRSATNLTARELEVLTLVAVGHTNREIAERLFISEKTASVHVTHAMDKLGALSRYDAAATAARLGLLGPTEEP